MDELKPYIIVLAIFLLLSTFTLRFLIYSWSDQITAVKGASLRYEEQLRTRVNIVSADAFGSGCDPFVIVANNTGETLFEDFSQMDVFVEYTDETNTKVATRIQHGTGWNTSVIPSTRDPGLWNPNETANISFSLNPPMKQQTAGYVIVVTPFGIGDSAYFRCYPMAYFHSETTDIDETDYYQLTADAGDGPATTISSVFSSGQTGRVRPASNNGKFVFSPIATVGITGSTWNVTYRVKRDKADFGFFWFTNAHDISLTTTGSWEDIDLSSDVPVGATGAIVELVNTGINSPDGGVVRAKGDTRDYMSNPNFGAIQINEETHRWQIVKVDSDLLIQGFTNNTDIAFKLLGYTIGPDPSYFSAPPDVTPGTKDSWTTVDVSSHVDADADGVILLVAGDAKKYGIRELGSSFSNTSMKLPTYSRSCPNFQGKPGYYYFLLFPSLPPYLNGYFPGARFIKIHFSLVGIFIFIIPSKRFGHGFRLGNHIGWGYFKIFERHARIVNRLT